MCPSDYQGSIITCKKFHPHSPERLLSIATRKFYQWTRERHAWTEKSLDIQSLICTRNTRVLRRARQLGQKPLLLTQNDVPKHRTQ